MSYIEYIFIYDQKNNLGIDADGNKYEVHKDKVIDLSTKEEIPIDGIQIIRKLLYPEVSWDGMYVDNRLYESVHVCFVDEDGNLPRNKNENSPWTFVCTPDVEALFDVKLMDGYDSTDEEVRRELGYGSEDDEDDESNNEVLNEVRSRLRDDLIEYATERLYDKFCETAQTWGFPKLAVCWGDIGVALDSLIDDCFG
jgi:hypothetical protein